MAIGAQNAFVLKQGLTGNHVFMVCLTCALSDALLVFVGVTGFGKLSEISTELVDWAFLGGTAFLVLYGCRSLLSAWRGGEEGLETAGKNVKKRAESLLTCLALTFLNPHVYLDTVFLLGSISAKFEGEAFLFGLGAVTASFAFFFSLGYGSLMLSPLLRKPGTWRMLDLFVGLTMFAIAAGLGVEYLQG